jgi:hypothetical protein
MRAYCLELLKMTDQDFIHFMKVPDAHAKRSRFASAITLDAELSDKVDRCIELVRQARMGLSVKRDLAYLTHGSVPRAQAACPPLRQECNGVCCVATW